MPENLVPCVFRRFRYGTVSLVPNASITLKVLSNDFVPLYADPAICSRLDQAKLQSLIVTATDKSGIHGLPVVIQNPSAVPIAVTFTIVILEEDNALVDASRDLAQHS